MQKPNVVVLGGDSFLVQRELKRWKAGFLQKHGDTNIDEISEPESNWQSLAFTPPFLAEKRLLITRNLLATADLKKAEWLAFFERLPDSTVLLMIEENIEKLKILKDLASAITINDLKAPAGRDLIQWIVQAFAQRGRSIDPRLAQTLVDPNGTDLWAIEQAIEGIHLRAKAPQISAQDLSDNREKNLEITIFAVVDAIGEKNHKKALTGLRILEKQGEDVIRVMSMVVRQFRLLSQTQAYQHQGLPSSLIASKLKVPPFAVQKLAAQARGFTEPQLNKVIQDLQTLDRRIKTGKLHLATREEGMLWVLLEKLVLKA